MTYVPNLAWTVADADQVQRLADQGYSASAIASLMGRAEADVRKFCADNRITVRAKSMVRA